MTCVMELLKKFINLRDFQNTGMLTKDCQYSKAKFVRSNFSSCPVAWLFFSKKTCSDLEKLSRSNNHYQTIENHLFLRQIIGNRNLEIARVVLTQESVSMLWCHAMPGVTTTPLVYTFTRLTLFWIRRTNNINKHLLFIPILYQRWVIALNYDQNSSCRR